MLAVTMPQRSLVWSFQWPSLMADRTSPVAMDTDFTSGSSVDNENTTLSQLLDAFQEDEETSMAPLNGIGDTDNLISVPFLNGSMEMNNDILDLSKPLQMEGLQHGISSMSIDSLNSDNFVDAVEVQTVLDDSCLSGMSELNSCPDFDVENGMEEIKENERQMPKKVDSPNHYDGNIDNESDAERRQPSPGVNMQEVAGSDSTKMSALSRSPESYTTLYKAFEIAQEEPVDTDQCDKPRESRLDLLNRTSPKLQRVALRKAKINPEKQSLTDNPVASDQKLVTTLQKQSPSQDSRLDLTWKHFGTDNGKSVTTFADILQKKGTPSPKSENFMNLETNGGIHWTELMQKSDSETENGVVRRIRRTKRISRPKSLPIQLRHIRRPASRPLKTPEDKQSKAYKDFLQYQSNPNDVGEDDKSSALNTSHRSAPTPRKTQWDASTPVDMDTRTSPSCSPPSLSFLPFYLKRPIRCNQIPAVTPCSGLRKCFLQNGLECKVDNIAVTLNLHTREAPDGISESPSNKLNLILTSQRNDKVTMIDDNADINANVAPKNHLLEDKRSDIFSSDSESEENTSDTSEESASPIDFESGISESMKCNGQSEGSLLSDDYDWVSLESVLKPPSHVDALTQQGVISRRTPELTLQELHRSIYDNNGNSLSKLMYNHNKREDIIIRPAVSDITCRKTLHPQDSKDCTNSWPNQSYNGNSDKTDTSANPHWNTFDYLDAEETFLPLEPLPDYADSESIEPSHITTMCSSDALTCPSDLDADSVSCADNESFYLSLPPGHGNPIISSCYSRENSNSLNSTGGTETSSTNLSSSLSSLAKLQACKNSHAPDSRSQIPFLTKSNDATNPMVAKEDQTDICYRPMSKLSEAAFLRHNLQDPMKENSRLKQFIPGKSISPAQKSSVIPDPESNVKSGQKRNPTLIYELLEQLKEQAVELELKRLKRNSKFPVTTQTTVHAAPKRKEVTFTHQLNHHTGKKTRVPASRDCSPFVDDNIQYIDHRPLKPIHVVDADYRQRKAQKYIHERKDKRGYYEPMYMTNGYHTLPAVLNWYKNRQEIYTDQSHTSFKKHSPIRNKMTDLKSDVPHRKKTMFGKHPQNRDATRSIAVEDVGSEDGFDDWQDLQGEELPPQDITLSPRPNKQTRQYEVDMVVMKGLVTAVSSAVDLILDHFSRTSETKLLEKAVLGDTVRNPTIGFLVLDHLCPAIANILKDGMKPYIRNYIIGRVKNSMWQVVEATTELGPGTRSLYELVCLIQEQKSLSTDTLKFNAFIFGLLSTKCLEVWLNHIRHHPDIVRSYFDRNAFLSQCNTSTNQLFNDLMVAVQPLSLLPFKLALDFEVKYTQKQTYLTRDESFMADPQSFMSLPWLGRINTGPRSLPKKDEGQGVPWQSWASPSNLLSSLRIHKGQSHGTGVESTQVAPQHQKSDSFSSLRIHKGQSHGTGVESTQVAPQPQKSDSFSSLRIHKGQPQNSDFSWMRSKELLKTAIIGRDKASIKKKTDRSHLNTANSQTQGWSKTEGVQTRDKTFQTQRKTVKHDSISTTERNQITEGVSLQTGSSKSWSLGWMTGAVSKKLYGEESHKQDTKYPIIGADESNSSKLQRTNQSEGLSERSYPSTSVMDNIGSNVIKAFDYMLLPRPAPKEIQMVEMRRTRPQKDGEQRMQTMPPADETRRQTAPSSDEAWRQTAPPSASRTQQNSVKTRCYNVSMEEGFLSFSKGEILQLQERIDRELLLCSKGEETGLVYEAHVEKINQLM